MNINDNKSPNQEIKKEFPDKNIDHDFRPEKAELELKEAGQSNCQSCNDLKNDM